jgi:hypothetical protein
MEMVARLNSFMPQALNFEESRKNKNLTAVKPSQAKEQ